MDSAEEMSSRREPFFFIFVSLGLLIAVVCDLLWGTTPLSFGDLWSTICGEPESEVAWYVLYHIRLPKMLTALVAGAGVSIAGLQMQSLFRNPLADTSILGVNSGAGVGVALYTMAYTLFPSVAILNEGVSSWGIIISACLGSSVVLLLITLLAQRLQSIVSVLIVGVMLGFLASSIISILQYMSDEETLKTYLLWSFGSVGATTWRQLSVFLPIALVGLSLSLLLPKAMNAMALGEGYARSVGVRVGRVRIIMIALTSLLAGSITAFTGPIAFLGLSVPHMVRMCLRTSNHRSLIPATMLSGALLLVVCDILTQMPGRGLVLPINAITSLIGAPIVIAIIWRSRRGGAMGI